MKIRKPALRDILSSIILIAGCALTALGISLFLVPNKIAAGGVTGLEGRGLYTGNRKELLVCVLKSREVPRLKRIVRDIDPEAFVYLTDVREVFGEGFQVYE